MNILEELWYGNIRLNERSVPGNSDYAECLRRVICQKEMLLADVPETLRKKMERILDAYVETESIAERDAFIMGFRLATRLMVDVLTKPVIPEG